MHTYNDAIRRTVGSYVIYPGTDDRVAEFRRYHELLPGVGAFAIRPVFDGDEPDALGTAALSTFIVDVAEAQSQKFSDLYRIGYYEHDTLANRTVNESYVAAPPTPRPPRDVTVAVVQADDLLRNASEHAALWWLPSLRDEVFDIPRALGSADYLVPVYDGKTVGRYFQILSVSIMTGQRLRRLLSPFTSVSPPLMVTYVVLHLGASYDLEMDLDLRAQLNPSNLGVSYLSWASLGQGMRAK